MMSPNGLHFSMLMQMARRGGHKSGRRIEPDKIDGYIQALRDNAAAEEKSKRTPPTRKEQTSWIPKWTPKVKAGGSLSAEKSEAPVNADNPPGRMSHKCGADRFLSQEEAGTNAITRAHELEQELTDDIPNVGTTEQIPAKVSWSAGGGEEPSSTITNGRMNSWHWDKCALPLDFKMFDFTDLEENTRLLCYMNDAWMYRDEEPPQMLDQSISTISHQEHIDDWWADVEPEMNEKLVPLVKEMMESGYSEKVPLEDLCILTLQHLIDGGSADQAKMATGAMNSLKRKHRIEPGASTYPL